MTDAQAGFAGVRLARVSTGCRYWAARGRPGAAEAVRALGWKVMAQSRPETHLHPIDAAIYDLWMYPQELLAFRRQRRRMMRDANGRVLELAAGTGLNFPWLNFPFYTRAREVVATDPDPLMLGRARPRAAMSPCPVSLVEADAESLPFEDGEFDSVVVTFGLCTIPDAEAAVREAHRVLTPDGRLLFLEHVHSLGSRVARLQDLADPAWSRLAGGCHPNRSSTDTIERHFEIDRLWRRSVLVQGSARRSSRARESGSSPASAR